MPPRTPPRAETESFTLRIVIVAPPPGVRWALQLGRADLVPPVCATRDEVVLEGEVTIGTSRTDGAPTLRGPAIQGPAAARFVYANVGTSAGDATSPWTRRAKVPLKTVTPALLAKLRTTPGAVLEARFAGTMKDGSPACATVPLLDGGWRVVRS